MGFQGDNDNIDDGMSGFRGQTTNFMQVIPDSHFWTNLEMMQEWFKYAHRLSKEEIIRHTQIALINMAERGYEIIEKCKDPIVQTNIDMLRERSNIGVKKYGTTLEQNNTDDFNVHLLQELLDACNYLQKIISNGKTETNRNREDNQNITTS